MADVTTTPPEQDFVAVLTDTFKLYKESWQALLLNLMTFILLAIVPVLVVILALPLFIVPLFVNGGSWVVAGILAALIAIVALVIICLFLPAMTVTQLASAKKQKIDFGEAFNNGLKFVLRYIGLSILIGLCVIVGFVLLIIPGLLAIFFLSLSTYILIDKNTGVIEAMKQSYELVKQNWMLVLALFIVNMAVSAVGYIPGIGWLLSLIASIVYFCLPAIIYTKIRK